MAAIGIGRAPLGVWRRLSAHIGAPSLDVRLAAGEDPLGGVALASRAAQLVSSRLGWEADAP